MNGPAMPSMAAMTLNHPLMPTRRQIGLLLAAASFVPSMSRADAPSWEEIRFDTPDGPLAYAVAGQGPLLVMLQGGPGGSTWALRHWAAPLTENLRVLLLDPIGRGRSARLGDAAGYTLERDVRDLERLREHLGLPQLSVYGHSYGGLLAQAWAVRHPQRVERLVLGDTLHGAASWQAMVERCNQHLQTQHPRIWAELLALRARGLRSAAPEYQALLEEPLEALYWHDLAPRKPGAPKSPQPALARRNLALYNAMLGPDPEWQVAGTLAGVELLPALASVQAPALVLTGRADRITPPQVAEQIAAALPQAELRIFERSGHRPFIEEPADWAARVSSFMRRTTP